MKKIQQIVPIHKWCKIVILTASIGGWMSGFSMLIVRSQSENFLSPQNFEQLYQVIEIFQSFFSLCPSKIFLSPKFLLLRMSEKTSHKTHVTNFSSFSFLFNNLLVALCWIFIFTWIVWCFWIRILNNPVATTDLIYNLLFFRYLTILNLVVKSNLLLFNERCLLTTHSIDNLTTTRTVYQLT